MQFVFERIDHILHLGLLLDDRRELLARFKNGLALRELIELLLVTDHFGIDMLKSFEAPDRLRACLPRSSRMGRIAIGEWFQGYTNSSIDQQP